MHPSDLLSLRDDVYRRSLITALERIDVEQGWKCADVGAGNGDVSVALAEVVGQSGRIYAIDIDPRRRNEIAETAAQYSQVIALTQAAEELSLPEKVDLAFCRFLLLGVTDPLLAVSAMAGVVKTGGWLVMQEPVTSSGRVGHDPLRVESESIKHPDIGLEIPKLTELAGLRLVDLWAEAPLGLGRGAASSYLSEMTGEEILDEVILLPPLVTVVAQKL